MNLKTSILDYINDVKSGAFTVEEFIGIEGNVPKGFQINDMSVIYKTKNGPEYWIIRNSGGNPN